MEATLLSERAIDGESIVELSVGAKCLVHRIKREELLENLDNWNKFVFLPEPELVKLGLGVIERGDLGVLKLEVPVVKLFKIAETVGIDRKAFSSNFKLVSTITCYPVVIGGGEKIRSRMVVEPNAYAHAETEEAPEIYKKFSGRLLVPDRIWLDTAHVTALYSKTPTLSNMFYAVRLKDAGTEAEKVLAYWLNTTWRNAIDPCE